MKRFIDPLFFAVVFLIDAAVWAATAFFGSAPATVVIMAPAFFSLALFALGRVYLNLNARRFYLFVAVAAGVFALAMWVTETLTPPLEDYDFSTGAWVLVVCGLGALLGLFLGLIGAIASPEKVTLAKAEAAAKRSQEKQNRKAERKAQKAFEKERRSQRKSPVTTADTVGIEVTEVVTEKD